MSLSKDLNKKAIGQIKILLATIGEAVNKHQPAGEEYWSLSKEDRKVTDALWEQAYDFERMGFELIKTLGITLDECYEEYSKDGSA